MRKYCFLGLAAVSFSVAGLMIYTGKFCMEAFYVEAARS
jgi:hypothetical protein